MDTFSGRELRGGGAFNPELANLDPPPWRGGGVKVGSSKRAAWVGLRCVGKAGDSPAAQRGARGRTPTAWRGQPRNWEDRGGDKFARKKIVGEKIVRSLKKRNIYV